MRLGVITGLNQELKIIQTVSNRENWRVRTSGSDPLKAERLSRELILENCCALISFGVAGGINPKLGCGDLILADQVVDDDGALVFTSERWRSNLVKRLPNNDSVFTGTLLGSDQLIAKRNQKSNIYNKTKALAVDMESHRIGGVAQEFGVPFLVVRVVLDTAYFEIPDSLINIINSEGNPIYNLIFANLVKNPKEIYSVFRLSIAFRIALKKLRSVVRAVEPNFGFSNS